MSIIVKDSYIFFADLGESSSHTCDNEVCFFSAETFSRTSTIHPGIFLGRALWADSVSPRMNTIASRDQLKAIRVGENFAHRTKTRVLKVLIQIVIVYFIKAIFLAANNLFNLM